MLPLPEGTKINLFGWASTNPIYGGAGSGGINDLFPVVSLIDGLKSAGFEINQDLVDFYLGYAESRAAVSITAQNWDLPEPPAANYTDELIAGAQDFCHRRHRDQPPCGRGPLRHPAGHEPGYLPEQHRGLCRL